MNTGSPTAAPAVTGRMALFVRRGITATVFVIAGLSFAFGFGNGWALGVQLGVPTWIAPLAAPAVDLSCVALLTAIQFLRTGGVPQRLVGPRLLLVFCGLITFALNTAKPILDQHYGRACFDAVAPTLLMGWGEVGPGLLALLHSDVFGKDDASEAGTVQDDVLAVPDEIGPSPQLVAQARQADAAHREATGRAITRDVLRKQLKVSNAVAGELVRIVRAGSQDGGLP